MADEVEGGFRKRASRAGTKVVARPESLKQQLFLPAVIKGLGVTMRHFFGNLASAQRAAHDAQIPFWNIVLAVQHGPSPRSNCISSIRAATASLDEIVVALAGPASTVREAPVTGKARRNGAERSVRPNCGWLRASRASMNA